MLGEGCRVVGRVVGVQESCVAGDALELLYGRAGEVRVLSCHGVDDGLEVCSSGGADWNVDLVSRGIFDQDC